MTAAIALTFNGTVQEFRRWQLWFPALFVIIAAVSVYDTYLIIRFKEIIYMMECNPMGRWLLEIAGGQVGVFVRVKLAGTLLVLSTLMFMWKWRAHVVSRDDIDCILSDVSHDLSDSRVSGIRNEMRNSGRGE
ncbi:MAG: hypothetical protein WKF77_14805 [Planctomycetaceae bacterium]